LYKFNAGETHTLNRKMADDWGFAAGATMQNPLGRARRKSQKIEKIPFFASSLLLLTRSPFGL
jgi:hypothetical protein